MNRRDLFVGAAGVAAAAVIARKAPAEVDVPVLSAEPQPDPVCTLTTTTVMSTAMYYYPEGVWVSA